MRFNLNKVELARIKEFQDKHRVAYSGAIGGQFSYKFTPTSLGDIITVIDGTSGEELNVTDFDSW